MTEKAKSKKSPKKVRATEKSPVEVNRRREWRFELPLPAEIEGHMPEGKKFAEKTILENISSTGAYFSLDSNLVVGSKVNLTIELPPEFTEGRTIKLCLDGETVRLEKKQKVGRKQGVAVRFKRDFRFQVED
ncbi:MAG TPA: PilZ domain-containing protein [Candidatus Saccharicenans sp.]|jgi:c-di-GMP-binding flagellar brake protein YcgR|nr:PilZ domain-containing protein [Candidatus Saccharicenans sp.]HRD02352.1 PilZ domain-containing protein [Candidatus Saccharicenans sp.]